MEGIRRMKEKGKWNGRNTKRRGTGKKRVIDGYGRGEKLREVI